MQDPQNYLSETVTAFLGAAVTWFGRWLFDWNKERKEVQKSEVELSAKIATMWREQSQELEGRLKTMREELNTLLDKMATIESENSTLLGKMATIESENRALKQENKKLKNELEKLTKRVGETEKHGE